ncbi:MAG: hypothetical protein R3Y68_10435 [Rikenellaceae bacterium]
MQLFFFRTLLPRGRQASLHLLFVAAIIAEFDTKVTSSVTSSLTLAIQVKGTKSPLFTRLESIFVVEQQKVTKNIRIYIFFDYLCHAEKAYDTTSYIWVPTEVFLGISEQGLVMVLKVQR